MDWAPKWFAFAYAMLSHRFPQKKKKRLKEKNYQLQKKCGASEGTVRKNVSGGVCSTITKVIKILELHNLQYSQTYL